MDILYETASEVPPSLQTLQNSKHVVGIKQLKRALRDGSARQVFLAEDADPQLTGEVTSLCREHGVPYTWVATMADLGKACGISVGAAAAAAL